MRESWRSSARTAIQSPGPNDDELAASDRAPVAAGPARSGEHVDEGVEAGVPGELEEGAGETRWRACRAIGVWVEPGPRCPPTWPAMTRTRPPPSGVDNRVTWSASSPW